MVFVLAVVPLGSSWMVVVATMLLGAKKLISSFGGGRSLFFLTTGVRDFMRLSVAVTQSESRNLDLMGEFEKLPYPNWIAFSWLSTFAL